ncbi:MAG: aspartate--tRNA ligase [Salibacteraceae bacterium]
MLKIMLRTHTCGELALGNIGEQVTLCGWVQRVRNMGGMTFIDLRDRYGITQLSFNLEKNRAVCEDARKVGREFVLQAVGTVVERESKNPALATGDIEVLVSELKVLNRSETPPFIIDDETDGGEELRMKYRYLDLRRSPLRKNLELRHKLAIEVRKYLDGKGFLEIETPYLIKSTPEGARDFVVPSRLHPGQFYALPQSPQTFKQLLMISGYDRYFQLVRCFRDEDLRADRQPEFTQIDCEMAFVEQEDIMAMFEGLMRHLFKAVKGIDLPQFARMTYAEAMEKYGTDKPDIRFGMEFIDLADVARGVGFGVFDQAQRVLALVVPGGAAFTRKQIDELTAFVKRPQVGASGLIYCRCNTDGSCKSSVDKFFDQQALSAWAAKCNAKPGDLILVMAGDDHKVHRQLSELRLEVAATLGLRSKDVFAPLWVVDFPLLEWDDEAQRFFAMHHPFTSPHVDDIGLLDSDPARVKAQAYDMVINGVELGGGSIRIHDRSVQAKMFDVLGFTPEEAEQQFGFLLGAFRYGAPPHGGIAFGFDRLAAIFGGTESIRDYIAFPKNNAGRDLMIDSPSNISDEQLRELSLRIANDG